MACVYTSGLCTVCVCVPVQTTCTPIRSASGSIGLKTVPQLTAQTCCSLHWSSVCVCVCVKWFKYLCMLCVHCYGQKSWQSLCELWRKCHDLEVDHVTRHGWNENHMVKLLEGAWLSNEYWVETGNEQQSSPTPASFLFFRSGQLRLSFPLRVAQLHADHSNYTMLPSRHDNVLRPQHTTAMLRGTKGGEDKGKKRKQQVSTNGQWHVSAVARLSTGASTAEIFTQLTERETHFKSVGAESEPWLCLPFLQRGNGTRGPNGPRRMNNVRVRLSVLLIHSGTVVLDLGSALFTGESLQVKIFAPDSFHSASKSFV